MVLLLATGILPEKEPVHFHFMHTVKAAEPESIRQPAQRAPAPNRPRLEGLACINSKKWDKGDLGATCSLQQNRVVASALTHRTLLRAKPSTTKVPLHLAGSISTVAPGASSIQATFLQVDVSILISTVNSLRKPSETIS